MNRSESVIVIGSGVAGMATAIRLKQAGFDVLVIESNSYPGGKLSNVQLGDYRFDAGPSLFTLPNLVDELFQLCNKKRAEYFNYERLDILCNYFFDDGKAVTAHSDINRFADELATQCGEPKLNTLNYLKESKRVYDITEPVFLKRSLHKIDTYFQSATLKAIPQLPSLHMFETMASYNKRFFKSTYATQLFNRYATYNGSDPYRAPATLNLIPHLEYHLGAYLPVGGMISITQSLYQLATDIGVRFAFDERVLSIHIASQSVKGVHTSKGSYTADIVVSNMDIYPTYNKLMPEQSKPSRILNQPRSGSALIFYWGINAAFSSLDVHNIFFSADYEKEFGSMSRNNTICDDPTVYVNITSKKCKGDAPKGKENWFVLINTPPNTGQDWDQLIQKTRMNVLNKLSRLLKRAIEPLIEVESILDPRSIELKTSSYQGALYGSSSNNRMAAFFRHKNFSSDIRGLYFCGGSVHPGGGIPLCLMGAAITASLIEQEHKI